VPVSPQTPNMSQRALMLPLSLDVWKLSDRLPIRAGEMMLNRLLQTVGSKAGVKSTIQSD
jgi:hypothetical protein